MFNIEFYVNEKGEVPVQDYLKELKSKAMTDKKSRVLYEKIYYYIGILERFGTRRGEKYTKHIEDDIWELRPIGDRIFFFYWKDDTFVLLHCFRKKTQKTPRREIEQAKRNRDDFLRSMK